MHLGSGLFSKRRKDRVFLCMRKHSRLTIACSLHFSKIDAPQFRRLERTLLNLTTMSLLLTYADMVEKLMKKAVEDGDLLTIRLMYSAHPKACEDLTCEMIRLVAKIDNPRSVKVMFELLSCHMIPTSELRRMCDVGDIRNGPVKTQIMKGDESDDGESDDSDWVDEDDGVS
jgi:hypothetical protein